MAYAVSQNFKDKIKDQTSAKSCLILFDDLFFSTADFTDSGVVFNQYFNTSEDLTFGDCPSDTLSFSVVANGGLKAYPFGDAKTYLGVQTGTESFAMPSGYNGYISYGGTVYSARDTGIYKDSTKLVDGVFFSVVSDGTYVWAHGEPGTYKHEIGSNTASKVMLITFMQRKLASGLSAVFAQNTATVWTDTEKQTWEYVPMGVYRVERPKSTIGQVVTIQDAYDRMSLFDKDGSAFLASLSYPKTLSQIYTALCSYVGVSYVSSTFTYSTTSYASSPFPDSSCTLRDVLSWIAERARSVAHFNRVGALDLVWCGAVDAEQLTPDQVQADGFVVSEYVTDPVDSVLLKSTDGSSLSFGTTFNNPYQIFGNPFISTISAADLTAYQAIPTYVPVELGVFECDPSIDLGDLIGTLGVSKKYVSFADAMGVALTDRYGVVFAEEVDGAFSFPLMNREVQFIGAIRAVYTATGGKQREYDADNTEYNALISVNGTQLDDAIDDYDRSLDQAEIMYKLTGGDQNQGIYIYNGKIYINAEYIQAGTLSANYISGGTLSGVRVEATTGGIGGWGIHDSSITSSVQAGDYAPTGERYFYYCYLNGFAATTASNQSFLLIRKQTFSGSTGYDLFRVRYDGTVYCSDISANAISGGSLSISGTSSLGGNTTVTGTLTASSDSVAKAVLRGNSLDFYVGSDLQASYPASGLSPSTTVVSGYNTYGGITINYAKWGKMVVFSGTITIIANISTNTGLFTVTNLPKPKYACKFLIADTSATSTNTRMIYLDTSGKVDIRGAYSAYDSGYVAGAYVTA